MTNYMTKRGPAILTIAALSLIASAQAGADRQTEATSPSAQTPRQYQRDGARTDVFARLVEADRAVAALPATDKARRAAMVAAIRRNLVAARSTFDLAELDRVLTVIGAVPRERFVPDAARAMAYIPFPLQIGYGQTISDAYIVAVMTAAIRPRPGDHVLDIGTGSGYQAAILSRLVDAVASIEIVKPLARAARSRLKRLGYRNVDVVAGDGFGGVPRRAPFDAILVAAGARAVPQPLIDQLKTGGRLVMPIGPTTFEEQLLLLVKRADGTLERCSLGPAAFVPFTGVAEGRGPTDRTPVKLCYGAPVT